MDSYQRLTTLAALRTQNEAADEYKYVVRTTLAPHPPRYLPHPSAIHIFAQATPPPQRTTCRVGANATGMDTRRGRAVMLDVVKKSLQPISTRRPIPAAYFCRRRVPSPQRSAHRCILPSGNRGLQATEEVLGDFLGSDRAVAYGLPPRLDGVVAADPGGR